MGGANGGLGACEVVVCATSIWAPPDAATRGLGLLHTEFLGWRPWGGPMMRRANGALKRWAFDAVSLVGALVAKDWSVPAKHGWYGAKVFGFTRLVELLRKRRPKACRQCALDKVCDHVWKDYVAHHGEGEITAVPGPVIRHPAWSYVMAHYRRPGVRLGGRKSLPASSPTS